MHKAEAIDLVVYAIGDARRFHDGELTAEFTIADVRLSIKNVLRELMDDEPTDEDADEVLET